MLHFSKAGGIATKGGGLSGTKVTITPPVPSTHARSRTCGYSAYTYVLERSSVEGHQAELLLAILVDDAHLLQPDLLLALDAVGGREGVDVAAVLRLLVLEGDDLGGAVPLADSIQLSVCVEFLGPSHGHSRQASQHNLPSTHSLTVRLG